MSTLHNSFFDSVWNTRDSEPERALFLFDSIYPTIKKSLPPKAIADYLNKKGALLIQLEQNQKGFDLVLQGLEIRKKHNLNSELQKSYVNIGNYYHRLKEYETAKKYYEKTIQVSLKYNDSNVVYYNYNNLAAIYIELEQYDSSLLILKRISQYNPNENKTSEYLNFGATYESLKKYDSATHYNQLALNEAIKHNNSYDVGFCYYNLGIVTEYKKELSSAILYYQKADSIAKLINDKETERDSKYALYEIFNNQGKYKNAINYLEQYIDLELEIQQKSKDKTLLELQTKFETQEKVNEINLLKKDNEIQTQTLNQLYLTSGILLLLLLALGIFYALLRQRQKTKNLEQQKRIDDLMRQKEMERVNAMLSGQENERKRIAEALHDQIGSLLSTVKHYLSSIDRKNKHELITKAELQLDNAIEEMRRISQNLVSGVLVKFGLIAAVKELANTIRDSGTLNIKVISTGFDERLNSDMEIYVYRILQELISNALKHAKAQSIVIRLKQEKENILLIIKDDGIGFSPQSIDKNKTTGLNNIIQRVELKKGRIKIDSESQKGTTIGIEMPYQ